MTTDTRSRASMVATCAAVGVALVAAPLAIGVLIGHPALAVVILAGWLALASFVGLLVGPALGRVSR